MKFGVDANFRKIFVPRIFLLSAIVDVEVMKTTLEVEVAKHIFISNISEMIEDTIFV